MVSLSFLPTEHREKIKHLREKCVLIFTPRHKLPVAAWGGSSWWSGGVGELQILSCTDQWKAHFHLLPPAWPVCQMEHTAVVIFQPLSLIKALCCWPGDAWQRTALNASMGQISPRRPIKCKPNTKVCLGACNQDTAGFSFWAVFSGWPSWQRSNNICLHFRLHVTKTWKLQCFPSHFGLKLGPVAFVIFHNPAVSPDCLAW